MTNVVEYTLSSVDTIREILGGVSEQEADNLIQELVRVKKDGKKVYVTAAGRANLVMRAFAMRLMQIGFQSYVVFDTSTPAAGAGDLLIAGSGSGTTETVVVIARKAKKLGMRTALFYQNADSELAGEVDAAVRIPTERCSKKLQTKGSEFEQSLFILCDNIGVELMKQLGCIRDIHEIDHFIKELHANLQ